MNVSLSCICFIRILFKRTFSSFSTSSFFVDASFILAILSIHFCLASPEFFFTSFSCFQASLSLFRIFACVRFLSLVISCLVRAASFFPFSVIDMFLVLERSRDFHNKTWSPASVRSGDLYYPCCFCFTAFDRAFRMRSTISSSSLLYCTSNHSVPPCFWKDCISPFTCFSMSCLVKSSSKAVRKSPRIFSFSNENSRCWGGT